MKKLIELILFFSAFSLSGICFFCCCIPDSTTVHPVNDLGDMTPSDRRRLSAIQGQNKSEALIAMIESYQKKIITLHQLSFSVDAVLAEINQQSANLTMFDLLKQMILVFSSGGHINLSLYEHITLAELYWAFSPKERVQLLSMMLNKASLQCLCFSDEKDRTLPFLFYKDHFDLVQLWHSAATKKLSQAQKDNQVGGFSYEAKLIKAIGDQIDRNCKGGNLRESRSLNQPFSLEPL